MTASGQSDSDDFAVSAMFDFPLPPAEWIEEKRRTNLALVANAAVAEPAEPTQAQREHSAMAQTLIWFGSRIEALEKERARAAADRLGEGDG